MDNNFNNFAFLPSRYLSVTTFSLPMLIMLCEAFGNTIYLYVTFIKYETAMRHAHFQISVFTSPVTYWADKCKGSHHPRNTNERVERGTDVHQNDTSNRKLLSTNEGRDPEGVQSSLLSLRPAARSTTSPGERDRFRGRDSKWLNKEVRAPGGVKITIQHIKVTSRRCRATSVPHLTYRLLSHLGTARSRPS